MLHCSWFLGVGGKTETALTSLPLPPLPPRPSRSSLMPAVKLCLALLCKRAHVHLYHIHYCPVCTDLSLDTREYLLLKFQFLSSSCCLPSFCHLLTLFLLSCSSYKSLIATVSPAKPCYLVCLFICFVSGLFLSFPTMLSLVILSHFSLFISLSLHFVFSHYLPCLSLSLYLPLYVTFVNGVVTLTDDAVAGSVAGKCMTC